MHHHRLHKRYGRAATKRSAAAKDFLRWAPGWWIREDSGANKLVVYRMAATQGASDGPDITIWRVSPREWQARWFGKVGTATTPRQAILDAGGPV